MKLILAYKILTAVMAVVMGTTAAGGGAVLASADSLPGDALYPVKLFTEDTRLALTADPSTQAALMLRFAAERTEEMQRLMARGEPVPEGAIDRMAQHTEQVMAQIAQAQSEDVPGLLKRVTERTHAQFQVLEQVRAHVPGEMPPALRRALEVTERAYETASAAHGDPQRFQKEYQHRYQGTPGPHGETPPSPTPALPCDTCTPEQEQNREREQSQNQNQAVTPAGDPQQDRDRDRDRDTTHTPEPPGPCQTCTPEQERDRDRDRDRDMTHTPEPSGPCETCTPERDREQDRDRTRTPEPAYTSEPAVTPGPPPIKTSEPTQAPAPKPQHTPASPQSPKPPQPPEHGGQGKGH